MIQISVIREAGAIKEVRCAGHSGYAKRGEDIVCSAVSAVVQTALLGLLNISPAAYEKKDGFLSFVCPPPDTQADGIRQQAILEAMTLGLRDLHSGYKAFINMEER